MESLRLEEHLLQQEGTQDEQLKRAEAGGALVRNRPGIGRVAACLRHCVDEQWRGRVSKRGRLLSVLADAESLLLSHGEEHWASRLGRDAALIRAGDAVGLQQLLQARVRRTASKRAPEPASLRDLQTRGRAPRVADTTLLIPEASASRFAAGQLHADRWCVGGFRWCGSTHHCLSNHRAAETSIAPPGPDR